MGGEHIFTIGPLITVIVNKFGYRLGPHRAVLVQTATYMGYTI